MTILYIPDKESSVNDPTRLPVAFKTIERWANSLQSSGYASLTGPGQTTTPGALTQAGGFTVQSPSGGSGILLQTNAFGPADTQSIEIVNTAGSGGVLLADQGGGGLVIEEQNATVPIALSISSNAGISIQDNSSVGMGTGVIINSPNGQIVLDGPKVNIAAGATSELLAFFKLAAGSAQQTVTGSRGGNAALASLLSALAAYNLIVNSSTP